MTVDGNEAYVRLTLTRRSQGVDFWRGQTVSGGYGLSNTPLLIPQPLLLGVPRGRGDGMNGARIHLGVTRKLGVRTARIVFPPFSSCNQEEKGSGDEEV